MRIRRFGAALALLVLVACGTTPNVPAGATADQVYAMAEERQEAGVYGAAQSLYEKVYEDYPSSPLAEPAQWLAVQMAMKDDEPGEARLILQDYHEIHPVSRLAEVGEIMYRLGEQLYEDGKSGILGIGLLPATGQGIATMEWITINLRTGARADDAYLFLGRARMDDGAYEEATADFEMLLENYPESEWALEARYLLAESWLAMNRGPAYDLESLLRARAAWQDYIRQVEKSEMRRQDHAERLATARERLAETNARLARKNLLIADFYESVERPEAAEIYLRDTLRDYAETPAASEAADRLGATGTEGE